MLVSGVKVQRYGRERASASGRMVVCMRATGAITRLTTLVACLIKRETSMRVSGRKKKLMALAFTYTKMVPFIAVSGIMTHRRARVSSAFPMDQCSLGTSYRV